MSRDPTWRINLNGPPRIRQIGAPAHGQVAVERWHDMPYWSMHAYQYRARLRVDDTWLQIEPGTVSVFRPRCRLEYHFSGISRHLFVHFEVDEAARGPLTAVPVLLNAGDRFDAFYAAFREAIAYRETEPARARARVWDLLWQLPSLARPQPTSHTGHAIIDRAVAWIEQHLSAPLSIAELCDALDVSHAHLARLFRERLGTSPLMYVHRRRATLAESLLRHSELPIKAIASQVGLVDLQQLNKLARRVLGRSPRAVRTARSPASSTSSGTSPRVPRRSPG